MNLNTVSQSVAEWSSDPMNIYVGRGSPFGNPFRIGIHGSRDTVIAKFEQYLRDSPGLLSRLGELQSKYIGCFCAPNSCHGAVVLDEMK